MSNPIENLEDFLSTVAEMLDESGDQDAVELLRNSYPQVTQLDSEDFTLCFSVDLLIDARQFSRLGQNKDELIKKISDLLVPLLNEKTRHRYVVKIKPKVEKKAGWREPISGIPEKVRKDILNGMHSQGIDWFGDLSDTDFLEDFQDPAWMPATSSDFENAYNEICYYRKTSNEWESNWIFEDRRFGLMTDPSAKFLQFLCRTLHPKIRSDQSQVSHLLKFFNERLIACGWHIVEEGKIGGRPCYVAKSTHFHNAHAISRVATVSDILASDNIRMQIQRIVNAIDTDPATAIGGSKELIESGCKHILDKIDSDLYNNSSSISELTKAVVKKLNLVADVTSNKAKGAEKVKVMLSNLTSLTAQIDELRNLYGTGHGPGSNHEGLEPRHARLAFASAVAFIDFVAESYFQLTEASK